jgi:hypothetical protein
LVVKAIILVASTCKQMQKAVLAILDLLQRDGWGPFLFSTDKLSLLSLDKQGADKKARGKPA